MKINLNKFWIGLVSCFFAPLLLFLATWTALSGSPISEIGHWLRQPVFMQYLIFCMLPDLVMIFIGYKSDSYNYCRGGVLGVAPYLCTLFYLFT
mgnify:FL=1